MSLKKYVLFLACVFVTTCESAFVDTLTRCKLEDKECHRTVYQGVLSSIGKTGVPELGIPPIDPMKLINVSVSVLDSVKITMVDGVAKGISKCVFDSFIIDIEKETGTQEITCDLVIKGHYNVSADSPLIKDILGDGGLSGDGQGYVKLEKIRLSFLFPFYPKRKEDGEIYFICEYKNIQYKFDIMGKASFAANNIYLGKENVSDFVIKYLNENWKFLMKTFGKAFIDKAMEYYFHFAMLFFEGVPAKYYILDDLTRYLKN